ncbi:hypothetical protein D6I95_03430 [Alcaligenes faecalis]|nr:hypothetical protein D6I95_03430 [Alcaligenes faecalis]
MYHSPKESHPFCIKRYNLAKHYVKNIILNLDRQWIVHAEYSSYAIIECLHYEGVNCYYQVPFKTFREREKFRICVTSAYSIDNKPSGEKVGFFLIASKLITNRSLPHP